MSVAIRGTPTEAQGTVSATANKPTGVVQNDVLLMQIVSNGDQLTPIGWTLIATGATNNTGKKTATYILVAGAAEPAAYTYTPIAASITEIQIIAFSGVDTTTQQDAAATTAGQATTINWPAITTVTDNAMHVLLLLDYTNATGTTTPTNYTLGLVGTLRTASFYRSITPAGNVSGVTSTGGGGDGWSCCVALRPAPTVPTINTQPANATVYEGQGASFGIADTPSSGTDTHVWKFNGVTVQSLAFNGVEAATYIRMGCVLADTGGQITCVVTDSNGSSTSNAATMTVLPVSKAAIRHTEGGHRRNWDVKGWFNTRFFKDDWFWRGWTPATGGITTYNLSAADSITAIDSATEALAATASAIDSATLADAATSAMTVAAAASDAVTATDSASQVPVLSLAATDAVAAGDASTETPVLARSASDAATAADSATETMAATASAIDSATLADAATSAMTVAAAASDAVTATDSATQGTALPAAASDAVAAADASTQTPTLNVAASESIAATDAATALMAVPLSAADAVAASDAATQTAVSPVAAADAASATDVATMQAVLSAAAIDATSVMDVATMQAVLSAAAVEAASVMDAATLLAAVFSLAAADVIALLDAASAVLDASGDFAPTPGHIFRLQSELRMWQITPELRALRLPSENRTYVRATNG